MKLKQFSLYDWCITNNREDLLKEWDYKDNITKTPNSITFGSNAIVSWICPLGHKYLTSVHGRRFGRGCPYCSSRKLLKGFNDLEFKYPNIACEWNTTKNGSLTPDKVFPFSNQKVWWECAYGHEWKATINSRHESRCPHCYKDLRVSVREKLVYYNIKKHFPDTLENFKISSDHRINVDIYIPSLKLVIEYDGVQYHKNAERDNKRYQIILQTGNDLIRVREHDLPILILGESIILKSIKLSDVSKGINELLLMISRKYNINLPSTKIDADKDLPEVYKLIDFSTVENSLQSVYPKLAIEFHPLLNGTLTPDRITAHSGLKVYWKCPLGHDYQSTVNNRSIGKGCPYCAGKKVLIGFNDLQTLRPILALQWDTEKNILTPQQVTIGTHMSVYWKCRHGKSWKARICKRKTDECRCTSKERLTNHNIKKHL